DLGSATLAACDGGPDHGRRRRPGPRRAVARRHRRLPVRRDLLAARGSVRLGARADPDGAQGGAARADGTGRRRLHAHAALEHRRGGAVPRGCHRRDVGGARVPDRLDAGPRPADGGGGDGGRCRVGADRGRPARALGRERDHHDPPAQLRRDPGRGLPRHGPVAERRRAQLPGHRRLRPGRTPAGARRRSAARRRPLPARGRRRAARAPATLEVGLHGADDRGESPGRAGGGHVDRAERRRDHADRRGARGRGRHGRGLDELRAAAAGHQPGLRLHGHPDRGPGGRPHPRHAGDLVPLRRIRRRRLRAPGPRGAAVVRAPPAGVDPLQRPGRDGSDAAATDARPPPRPARARARGEGGAVHTL
ncbi:MAG: ABC transporter, permease protein 1 (cluster 11, riboflavin/purine nucleoside/unknown), partial [uncultured Thermoleophilia bacterium]